jgi:toxin-antitoxin system PIN domain toxin
VLLPDINVWLALAFEAHAHHAPAAEWFATQGTQSCAFCRFTQQGFLRLATNPSVFGEDAVTLATAWTLYDDLCGDERVFFLSEPNGLETPWRKLTKRRRYSHKIWSDAYLVAFAECAGARNVTFDKGFRGHKASTPLVLPS